MKDILKPITEVIIKRAKNPILLGFAITWLSLYFEAWTKLIFGKGEFEVRLKTFMKLANYSDFLWSPFWKSILIFLIISILNLFASYINLGVRYLLTLVISEPLARRNNRLLKLENDGKEYVEMQEKYNHAIKQMEIIQPLLNEISGLRMRLDEDTKTISNSRKREMHDNQNKLKTLIDKKIFSQSKDIDKTTRLEIDQKLNDLQKKMDENYDLTYEEVRTPIRKFMTQVEGIQKELNSLETE